ncbi:MAG: N-acetylmuramoyl-L-alanine amidase family protein [Cyclonatronaceae bacterium]
MLSVFANLLPAIAAGETAPASNIAQDTETIRLEAISTADRSDGLGYVVRFHFTARPDSFKVIQPEAGHTQMVIYHSDIKYDDVRLPQSQVFSSFEISDIPNGIGLDIRFLSAEQRGNDRVFIARAYPDQNGQHILLGYTEISKPEMQMLSDGIEALNWDTMSEQELSEAAPAPEQAPADTAATLPQEDILAENEDALINVNRSAIRFDTIILDAGHGGRDPGAVSPSGRYEKDIVLAVAKKVGEYIKEYLPELNVVYTREDDTFIGLAERGRIANRNQGNLFISIHTNSYSGRRASGVEFYFLGTGRSQSALEVMQRENSVIRFEEGEDATTELTRDQLMVYELQNIGNMAMSQKFAEFLNQQFSERAQRRSRGVKQAGLQVLFEASMPGVLAEIGFISNAQEEQFMTSEYGQSILASAIFRAVREYKNFTERTQNREQREE